MMRRLVLYWLPVALWMAVILGLSSQGQLPLRNDPVTGEKVAATYSMAKTWHVIEYAVLSVLLIRGLHLPGGGVGWRLSGAAPAAVLGCFGFAMLDELRQSFVPGREATFGDVILDTVAATLAALVVVLWLRLRSPTKAQRG